MIRPVPPPPSTSGIRYEITTLPDQLRRSLTWDQGAELAQHAQLRVDTGLEIL